MTDTCSCGLPLHYSDLQIQRIVQMLSDELGDTVMVKVLGTNVWYHVQRHYIALHGLRAAELPELARRYGWQRA